MITADGWSSRCESGNCMETRTRTVEGHEYVEVRDTETDGTLLVTAKAWKAFLAAENAAVREELERAKRDRDALMPVLEAAFAFVTDDDPTNAQIDALAHAVDVMPWDAFRPAAAVRDDTKGTADDG